MTVTITIGERIEDRSGTTVYSTVFRWIEPKAPLFPGDDITGHSNQRRFGFPQYEEFVQQTGLVATLLASVEGSVDGVRDLSHVDLDVIARTIVAWQTSRDAMPTFESEHEADWHLARLMWFGWWIEWTLEHCSHPSLAWSS